MSIAKYLHGQIPTWNDFVDHPNYDQFWQQQAMAGYLKSVQGSDADCRRLVGSGRFLWSDQYVRDARAARSARAINYFVAGPWNHGGWARGEGASLGRISFDSNTAQPLS
jgi:predicted acyl esterase